MNFASFAYSSASPALVSLQNLFRVFFAPPAATPARMLRLPSRNRAVRPPAFLRHDAFRRTENSRPVIRSSDLIPAISGQGAPKADGLHRSKVPPTLRVMRMLESGESPKSVGRMVISGRMADVCAELDRLAGTEQPVREAPIH